MVVRRPLSESVTADAGVSALDSKCTARPNSESFLHWPRRVSPRTRLGGQTGHWSTCDVRIPAYHLTRGRTHLATQRDEWLPAMPGCGWCEAQGRCLEGMREHPTTDFIGTTPGDGNLPPALGVAQNPNFCGPQSRQNATGQAQKRKQIWIKDVNPEAGENAELIAPTERYEMVLGTATTEKGFDEGHMN